MACAGLAAESPQALRTRAAAARDHGDYRAAEGAYRKALQLEKRPLERAQCLEELASLHFVQGQFQTALREWDDVLKEYRKAYGDDAPQTARVMAHMGGAQASLGELAFAEEVLLAALTVLEETPGPDHLDTADALQNLALVYVRTGRFASGAGLYRRALKTYVRLFGPTDPLTVAATQNLANALQAAGKLDEAETLYNQAIAARAADSPASAYALENLATLKLERKDPAGALEAARRAEAAFTRLTNRWLSYTGEEERLDLLASLHPYTVYAGAQSAPDLARAALRWKGLGLESLAEDQRLAQASRDPAVRALVEKVRAAGTRSEEEIRAAQAELARAVSRHGSSRRALQVTVAQVQAALPADAVLVEFLDYPVFGGSGVPSPLHYGAVVIPPRGEPRWVPLGSEEEINKSVLDFLRAVRSLQDAPLETALRALYQQLWTPVQAAFPDGTTTVILSPAGQLSLVSFSGLLTPDGTLLAETYRLLYVASGRDLLTTPEPPGQGFLAFGNPDFGKATTRGGLRPLPGTELEVKRLQELAGQQAWKPQVLLGADASEARLRAARSPRILHLATHGFFVTGATANPIDRSGVALAGAQSAMQGWARGEAASTPNDGILTAREAAGLPLDQTWLVTLSACDSGFGEASSGEGVMGLRRSLVLAGAQNLLLTLWPVPDGPTADFMLDFYQALTRTPSPPLALAQVQRNWLTRLRQERGPAAAVRTAGAFVVTFQGPLAR